MTDQPEIQTPPLDVTELMACFLCDKGVMHGGDVHFYEVEIRQCVVDAKNINRMHGMEMMMGGNPAIARALSPDNTVAQRIGPKKRRLLCASCALHQQYPVALLCEGE